LVAGALFAAMPAVAQDDADTQPGNSVEWRKWAPDENTIVMPELAFSETPEDAENYSKYYYFNRAGTSFAEALSDIRQCDDYARGLYGGDYSSSAGYAAGLGGAVGGMVGGIAAQAIYGSAEERRKRRVNMRRCMFFKGYERYGLSKDRWEEFNFEEGAATFPEGPRQRMLAQQAKVASGPRPATKELGL
jgi:hypothetical protein